VVKVGDRVAVGDLVARIPEGKLGSNLHASIAGHVANVGDSTLDIVA
jgi:biotin carboxyl carrier protein